VTGREERKQLAPKRIIIKKKDVIRPRLKDPNRGRIGINRLPKIGDGGRLPEKILTEGARGGGVHRRGKNPEGKPKERSAKETTKGDL